MTDDDLTVQIAMRDALERAGLIGGGHPFERVVEADLSHLLRTLAPAVRATLGETTTEWRAVNEFMDGTIGQIEYEGTSEHDAREIGADVLYARQVTSWVEVPVYGYGSVPLAPLDYHARRSHRAPRTEIAAAAEEVRRILRDDPGLFQSEADAIRTVLNAALEQPAPVVVTAEEAWDDGFDAGSTWSPSGRSGIPNDPPTNPYRVSPASQAKAPSV